MAIQDGRQKPPMALIVDDDPTFRLLTRELLMGSGFDVVEAEDGELGLLAFQRFAPDIILLDVMMPKMDGFAMCEALRKQPGGESAAVLIMTGLDDTESIHRAYEAGATDFITKPINPDEFFNYR